MDWNNCYSAYRRVHKDWPTVVSVVLTVIFWITALGALYYGALKA